MANTNKIYDWFQQLRTASTVSMSANDGSSAGPEPSLIY